MPTRITFLYLVDELKQSCLVFFSSMYRSGPILAIEPVVFSALTLLGFCEAQLQSSLAGYIAAVLCSQLKNS